MRRFFWLGIALAITVWATPLVLAQNSNAAANKLLAEANRLDKKAEVLRSAKEQVRLYEQALQKLNLIVSRHPNSVPGTKLMKGEWAGGISISYIQKNLATAKCLTIPVPCLINRALEVAKKDSEFSSFNKIFTRSRIFIVIAIAQAKSGNFEAAKENLTEAKKLLSSPNIEREHIGKSLNFLADYAFAQMAGAQALVGDTKGAQDSVQKISDISIKDRTYGNIFKIYSNSGNHRLAAKAANEMKNSLLRDKIYFGMAINQIQEDKITEALKAHKNIKSRPVALLVLAAAKYKSEKTDEARKLIKEALNIANNYQDSKKQKFILIRIYSLQLLFDDLDMKKPAISKFFQENLNMKESEFAKLEGFLLLFGKIGRNYMKGRDVSNMKFEVEKIQKSIQNLSNSIRKTSFILLLARYQGMIGDTEGAYKTLSPLLEKKEKFYFFTLKNIAKIQASLGDIPGAYGTIVLYSRHKIGPKKALALAEIAVILAHKNRKKKK